MPTYEPVFALFGCNAFYAFYASCERVFRPDLASTTTVVLSNNDSCVIARSYDAKPFVKMGAPYFQIKDTLRRHGVVALSNNYAMLGQMSGRVMLLIESIVSPCEIYPVDDFFADLTGQMGDLTALGRTICEKILHCTGIPVGVGIAHTKTLAGIRVT